MREEKRENVFTGNISKAAGSPFFAKEEIAEELGDPEERAWQNT